MMVMQKDLFLITCIMMKTVKVSIEICDCGCPHCDHDGIDTEVECPYCEDYFDGQIFDYEKD